MKPPPDMELPRGMCLQLLKSFYGLKKTPRNWHQHFVEFILRMGLEQSVLENCLFTMKKNGELLMLTLYVDDILICASDLNMLDDLKQQFSQNIEMKDLGELSQYLGIKITRENGTIKVDQKKIPRIYSSVLIVSFKVMTNVPF